jgi:diguanylate cyclase (GGDEF)-like protein
MFAKATPTFLLASSEPSLLSVIEPMLTASGAHIEVVLSAEAALAAMSATPPPSLVLLDVDLPGMEMKQLLAATRAQQNGQLFPIVLISDTITQEWLDRLAEGVIDDLISPSTAPQHWQVRLSAAQRTHRLARELELLRENAVQSAQMDRLTGVFNRETILSVLFRETDRVQRMKSSMCMILFDIDDFGHWNARLGTDACDDLLRLVVERTQQLLRSYDLLGRIGEDEFLVALPGCSSSNATMFTERLRTSVFCSPFRIGSDTIRLSACFGIAASNGRSPVVVLREAEQALQWAKSAGPESIQCFGENPSIPAPAVTYLSATSGNELLAW